MKTLQPEIPSNKKFGYFFTVFFLSIAGYCYINNLTMFAYALTIIATILVIITMTKADVLLPLNYIWMHFGLALGKIINPIILGIIFFGLFAPVAILGRLFGRDELRLKHKSKTSQWIRRDVPTRQGSFKQQF